MVSMNLYSNQLWCSKIGYSVPYINNARFRASADPIYRRLTILWKKSVGIWYVRVCLKRWKVIGRLCLNTEIKLTVTRVSVLDLLKVPRVTSEQSCLLCRVSGPKIHNEIPHNIRNSRSYQIIKLKNKHFRRPSNN